MQTKPDLVIGDHRVGTASGEVFRGPTRVAVLRKQSLDVLCALAEAPGDVFSKDSLISTVWGKTNVTDDSLVQCIAETRRAIGPDRRHLETVPRQGYRLSVSPAENRPTDSHNSAPVEPTAQHHIKLLVAPFSSASTETELRFFAEGLTADLIDALANNSDIIVLSHNSETRPHEAAKSLGAQYVFQGLVRQSGNRLVVNASMEMAEDGRSIFSKRIEGALQDALELQEQLSVSIANEICMHFAAGFYTNSFFSLSGETENLSAWRFLVQAVPYINQFQELSHRQIARRLINQALEANPDYVGALIALGDLEYLDWRFDQFQSNVDNGVKAVQHGLTINPNEAGLHASLARLRIAEKTWESAEEHAAIALDLQPNNALIVNHVAYVFRNLGHYDKAIQLCELAMQLDRRRRENEMNSTMAGCLLDMFRFDETLDLLDAMFEKIPQVVWIDSYRAIAAYHLGLFERADKHYARFMQNQTDHNNQIPNLRSGSRDPRVQAMRSEAETALHKNWMAAQNS